MQRISHNATDNMCLGTIKINVLKLRDGLNEQNSAFLYLHETKGDRGDVRKLRRDAFRELHGISVAPKKQTNNKP